MRRRRFVPRLRSMPSFLVFAILLSGWVMFLPVENMNLNLYQSVNRYNNDRLESSFSWLPLVAQSNDASQFVLQQHLSKERLSTSFRPSSNATTTSTAPSSTTTTYNNTTTSTMAACLMVRDDNALLAEWLAYHYMVLPLRHVVVAADLGSTQDPADILHRYRQHESFHYTVWNHSDFMERFGEIPVDISDENHHYIHRQRAFLTTCAEYMRDVYNQTWVAFVDTDEYIVLNRYTNEEEAVLREEVKREAEDGRLWNTTTARAIRLRQRLTTLQQQSSYKQRITTVRQALDAAQKIAILPPCHVVPRLLFGALENETCTGSTTASTTVMQQQQLLSTLRFHQHAEKGAFYPSKWGKVIVDVSRLDPMSLQQDKPKNAHRPFRECPKPLVAFDESLLHVHHYLGSWERYSARRDARRSREAFEERAYFSHGTSCHYEIYKWLDRLVELMGVEGAKYLLTGT